MVHHFIQTLRIFTVSLSTVLLFPLYVTGAGHGDSQLTLPSRLGVAHRLTTGLHGILGNPLPHQLSLSYWRQITPDIITSMKTDISIDFQIEEIVRRSEDVEVIGLLDFIRHPLLSEADRLYKGGLQELEEYLERRFRNRQDQHKRFFSFKDNIRNTLKLLIQYDLQYNTSYSYEASLHIMNNLSSPSELSRRLHLVNMLQPVDDADIFKASWDSLRLAVPSDLISALEYNYHQWVEFPILKAFLRAKSPDSIKNFVEILDAQQFQDQLQFLRLQIVPSRVVYENKLYLFKTDYDEFGSDYELAEPALGILSVVLSSDRNLERPDPRVMARLFHNALAAQALLIRLGNSPSSHESHYAKVVRHAIAYFDLIGQPILRNHFEQKLHEFDNRNPPASKWLIGRLDERLDAMALASLSRLVKQPKNDLEYTFNFGEDFVISAKFEDRRISAPTNGELYGPILELRFDVPFGGSLNLKSRWQQLLSTVKESIHPVWINGISSELLEQKLRDHELEFIRFGVNGTSILIVPIRSLPSGVGCPRLTST